MVLSLYKRLSSLDNDTENCILVFRPILILKLFERLIQNLQVKGSTTRTMYEINVEKTLKTK